MVTVQPQKILHSLRFFVLRTIASLFFIPTILLLCTVSIIKPLALHNAGDRRNAVPCAALGCMKFTLVFLTHCEHLPQEPTVEDTIAILRGLESRYEVFHGVKITDNAIIAAATLSNRYITDRFLPDKAIDLIDEACAMIRTEMDSMPTELDVINRKIIQMEIEEAALKNEDDELSKGRLSELQKELAEQRDKFNTMKAQ